MKTAIFALTFGVVMYLLPSAISNVVLAIFLLLGLIGLIANFIFLFNNFFEKNIKKP